eukprot:9774196-Alexandrium_andersonii.AAC.1
MGERAARFPRSSQTARIPLFKWTTLASCTCSRAALRLQIAAPAAASCSTNASCADAARATCAQRR